MKKWYIAYFSRGAYRSKYIDDDTPDQAIRHARVKNIIDMKEITKSKALAMSNPSAYIYIPTAWN